jgi:hypothetical protein
MRCSSRTAAPDPEAGAPARRCRAPGRAVGRAARGGPARAPGDARRRHGPRGPRRPLVAAGRAALSAGGRRGSRQRRTLRRPDGPASVRAGAPSFSRGEPPCADQPAAGPPSVRDSSGASASSVRRVAPRWVAAKRPPASPIARAAIGSPSSRTPCADRGVGVGHLHRGADGDGLRGRLGEVEGARPDDDRAADRAGLDQVLRAERPAASRRSPRSRRARTTRPSRPSSRRPAGRCATSRTPDRRARRAGRRRSRRRSRRGRPRRSAADGAARSRAMGGRPAPRHPRLPRHRGDRPAPRLPQQRLLAVAGARREQHRPSDPRRASPRRARAAPPSARCRTSGCR